MAALGPHWAVQVATSQPDSFLNQSQWQRDNGQVKHSSHMTPTTQETISKGSKSWPLELLFQPESSCIAPKDFPWQNNSTSHKQMHQPLSRHLWTVPENLQALCKYEDGPNDAAGSVIQKNEERFLKGDSASFYCSC